MTSEVSGSNPYKPGHSEDIQVSSAKDNCNYSVSAVLVVSAVTAIVLLILVSLAAGGILPNSGILLSAFSTGLVVSTIVFLVCLKLRLCPDKEFAERLDKLEETENSLKETRERNKKLLVDLQRTSEENDKRRAQEAKEGDERRARESKEAEERREMEEKNRISFEKLGCKNQLTDALYLINSHLRMLKVLETSKIPGKEERINKYRDEINSKFEICAQSLEKWKEIDKEDPKIADFEQHLQEAKTNLSSLVDSDVEFSENLSKPEQETKEANEADEGRALESMCFDKNYHTANEKLDCEYDLASSLDHIKSRTRLLKTLAAFSEKEKINDENREGINSRQINYRDEINSKLKTCTEKLERLKEIDKEDPKIADFEQQLQEIKTNLTSLLGSDLEV